MLSLDTANKVFLSSSYFVWKKKNIWKIFYERISESHDVPFVPYINISVLCVCQRCDMNIYHSSWIYSFSLFLTIQDLSKKNGRKLFTSKNLTYHLHNSLNRETKLYDPVHVHTKERKRKCFVCRDSWRLRR